MAVTYKASDIIKRAMQLADLENSDFISFSEKLALLNESYHQLYQKGINKDVNAFVKYIHTQSTAITLPRDFYQLKAVNIDKNGYLEPVLRRPANQSTHDISYEILNNTLKINGYAGCGDICIEYYPLPLSLTFPNIPKSISPRGSSTDRFLDLRNNIYVTANANNYITIGDITDSEVTEEISEDDSPTLYTNFIYIEEDYVVFTNGTNQTLYSLSGNGLITTTDKVVFYRHKTFLYDETAHTLKFPTGEVAYSDIDFDFGDTTLIILDEEMKTFVGLKYTTSDYVGSGVFIGGRNTETKELTSVKVRVTKLYNYKNLVYFMNGTSYLAAIDLSNISKPIQETIQESDVIDIVDIDDNTGYGYLTKRFGNRYNIMSFFEDTVLNFPNNTYFVFLSYILAVTFKTKQGSDISQLASLYSQAEEAFYDSLQRDDWGSTRITNIY